VLDSLADVLAALDGSGPPIAPYAAGSPPPDLPDLPLPEDVAFVVSTSGSTGLPKRVLLTPDNLLASAGAAHEVIGGPGAWMLTVPAHHIAGLQVIVRAALGTGEPTCLDLTAGFTPQAFVAGALAMPATAYPTFVSLVPTQLGRLLADPEAADVLAGFDAVLVGGGATSLDVGEQARDRGVRMIRTFGTTETSGGCVYDGLPLPVSEVYVDNDRHVVLGGATIACGYLGPRGVLEDGFSTDADGVRWFRTEDLGRLDESGRLVVTGRADDLINTGGVKVAPGPVEDALVRYLPGVRDAVVVAVPDPEWGQAVAAAVVLTPRATRPPTVDDARAALRGIVPDAALPRHLHVVDSIPLIGPGKPDRVALSATFSEDGRSAG